MKSLFAAMTAAVGPGQKPFGPVRLSQQNQVPRHGENQPLEPQAFAGALVYFTGAFASFGSWLSSVSTHPTVVIFCSVYAVDQALRSVDMGRGGGRSRAEGGAGACWNIIIEVAAAHACSGTGRLRAH